MIEENLDLWEIPAGSPNINLRIDENLSESDSYNFGVKLPYVIKNKILMSQGTWNNYFYHANVIKKAHEATDWNNKTVRNLYLDHEEGTSEWVGYIINPKFVNGTEYGDLHIYDPILAIKLMTGKPKFGISPRVKGNAEEGIMKEYIYENFSFVINPAVKTTYINNMEVKTMEFKEQDLDESVETPEERLVETELKEEDKKKEKKEELKKKEDEDEEMKKKEKYPKEELSEWTDKIKAWLKKNPGKNVQDAIEALKKEHEEIEMAEREARFVSLMEELLETMRAKLKKYKPEDKYPYKEGKYPYKKLEEMEESLKMRDKTIEELKEKTTVLEQKLNEPAAKVTVKSDEPMGTQILEYSDENFLNYIKDDVQGGVVEVG